MKQFFIAVFVFTAGVHAQEITSAGKWMGDNEQKGNPYLLASDDYTEKMSAFIADYNARDAEKVLAYYTSEYVEQNGEKIKESLADYENVDWVPFAMIPVKIKDQDATQMLVWSNESREWKNGSKQKLGLLEVFLFDEEDKIQWVGQWQWMNPDNEFGLPTGGKFFGKNKSDYSGRKLVFSNRGEVKAIEDFVAAYNKMDAEACKLLFADSFTMEQSNGKKVSMTKADLEGYFDQMESVTWKLYSIVPLKIENTDPASGVIVSSRETQLLKNGEVWDKELVENFYFDVDGKVNYIVQYARDVSE